MIQGVAGNLLDFHFIWTTSQSLLLIVDVNNLPRQLNKVIPR